MKKLLIVLILAAWATPVVTQNPGGADWFEYLPPPLEGCAFEDGNCLMSTDGGGSSQGLRNTSNPD